MFSRKNHNILSSINKIQTWMRLKFLSLWFAHPNYKNIVINLPLEQGMHFPWLQNWYERHDSFRHQELINFCIKKLNSSWRYISLSTIFLISNLEYHTTLDPINISTITIHTDQNQTIKFDLSQNDQNNNIVDLQITNINHSHHNQHDISNTRLHMKIHMKHQLDMLDKNVLCLICLIICAIIPPITQNHRL